MHNLIKLGFLGAFLTANADSLLASEVWVSSSDNNDLVRALGRSEVRVNRFTAPEQAIRRAPDGAVVLLLADGYPSIPTALDEKLWQVVLGKDLRLYVEFPAWCPGVSVGAPVKTKWERLVVGTNGLGGALSALRILAANDCRYLPVNVSSPLVHAAKVAGYDDAVFGLPTNSVSILFRSPGAKALFATTKLSGFETGRFAPEDAWQSLWNWILRELGVEASIRYSNPVRATYTAGEQLPANWQGLALRRAVQWNDNSGLLIPQDGKPVVAEALKAGAEIFHKPGPPFQNGDGRFGILEGFASQISFEGDQIARLPVRADCQAESAMVYAADYLVHRHKDSREKAANLLQFLYHKSDLHGGARGNPKHPAFGLISWGAIAPAWEVANYGDDNARTILATILSAAALKSGAWDEALLRALLANLRTTGKLGFRGDRIDMGPLEKNGWKSYADASPVSLSPHFEAYLWACYLWAYRQTGHREFLDKAKAGIEIMMKAFPKQWRWNDNSERARMVLVLAWLTRVEDTAQHRDWTRAVANDLLSVQDKCGALQERYRALASSHYQIPASNEAYGSSETPLLQENGDPVSDQLYVSGFALLGLHEAAAVLNDPKIGQGADRLAEFLARCQTRSKKFPHLDGTWFRAFDYEKWEAWASSGDAGWGAWCLEAGWAQSWGAALFGLREAKTSLWDLASESRIGRHWSRVTALMAENDGRPWQQAD